MSLEKFDSIEINNGNKIEKDIGNVEANEIDKKQENNESKYRSIFGDGEDKQKREFKDTIGSTDGHSYSMNSPKTIEHIRDQMGKYSKEYFDVHSKEHYDDKGASIGSGVGHKIELIPKGAQYHLTGDLTGDYKTSGNFLSKDNPGDTAKERQENLQLPPEKDGERVSIVESTKAQLGIKSTIAPQDDWADKAGYTARKGIEQTFIPNKNKDGALADGRFKVVEDITDRKSNIENDDPDNKETR